MSKKLPKKKKSLDLDFDFEAETVVNDPQPTIAPQQPPTTNEPSEADIEAERRRKIRQRQLAMQTAEQTGVPTPSGLSTIPTSSTSNGTLPLPTSSAESIQDKVHVAHWLFKSQPQHPMVSSSDGSDESSSDDDNIFTFMSSKAQKQSKEQTYKSIDLNKSATIQSADQNLSILAELSTAITEKAVEQVEQDQALKDQSDLPDDADYLEDLQIDITAWRHREAQRLFREIEQRMKALDL